MTHRVLQLPPSLHAARAWLQAHISRRRRVTSGNSRVRFAPQPQVLEAEKTLHELIAPDKTIKADAEERVRQAVDERAIAQAKSLKAHFDAFAQRLSQQQDAERQKQTEALVAAKLQQAEAAGEAGNVDEAQRLMQEAESLKASARSAPAGKNADPQSSADQKLRCCDICSAFLSIYDNERRLVRRGSPSLGVCARPSLPCCQIVMSAGPPQLLGLLGGTLQRRQRPY